MPSASVGFELLDEFGIGFLPSLVFLLPSLGLLALATFPLIISTTNLDGLRELVKPKQNL